jgi:Flp pilus assembly protein TadG
MRVLVRRSHLKDDRGAIAVLAAILIVGLLIPLSALAMTTHVREGAAAELQRAAEAGALAGAASIPLGNVTFLNSYLSGLPLNGFFIPGTPDPLTVACDQARKAIQADGDMNDAFSPNGTTLPANFCTAEYLPDATFLSKLGSCLGLSSLLPIVNTTKNVLPALLHGGVKVTLKRSVKGPMDGLLGGGATEQKGEAAAKRRFKNAVMLPLVSLNILGIPILPAATVDLNPYMGTAVDASLALVSSLDGLVGTLLPSCSGVLGLLSDDLGDLVNPTSGTQTVGDVLNDAFAAGDEIMVLRFPTSLPLVAPFFDFVPACLSKLANGHIQATFKDFSSASAFTGCATNTPGGFRASLVPVP